MTCRNVARMSRQVRKAIGCPPGSGRLVRDDGEVPGAAWGCDCRGRRRIRGLRDRSAGDRVGTAGGQSRPHPSAAVAAAGVGRTAGGRPAGRPGRDATRAGGLAAGTSDRHAGDPWPLVLDNAVTTARGLPALADRQVVLVSSVEVYGPAAGELPVDDATSTTVRALLEVARRPLRRAGGRPLPELVAVDPGGRWTYGLTKRAQELLVRSVVEPDRLTTLRLANVFGPGQDRVLARSPGGPGRAAAGRHRHRAQLPAGRRGRRRGARRRTGPVDRGWPRCRWPVSPAGVDTLALDVPVVVDPPPRLDESGRVDRRRPAAARSPGARCGRPVGADFVTGLGADRCPASRRRSPW